jgi:hypothetical protein
MPHIIEIIGGFLSAFGLYGVCTVLSDVTAQNSVKQRDCSTQTSITRSSSVPNIEPMYKRIFRNMSYPTLPYK